jgi:hypothetical protein
MLLHVTLEHTPDNCWARDEHEGKASELTERLETTEGSGVSVLHAHVAPNEHTFYLLLEADSFEEVTSLLGPPLLQDHRADIVPVTAIKSAMEATGVK